MMARTRKQPTSNGRGRGRPRSSDSFRVVPVPHSQIDPVRLGRVIVAIALHQQGHRDQAADAAGVDDERA